jgi:hypothetical protein
MRPYGMESSIDIATLRLTRLTNTTVSNEHLMFLLPHAMKYHKVSHRSIQMSRISASAFSLAECRVQATDPPCAVQQLTLFTVIF